MSSSTPRPIVTAAVLIETSVGTFVVDLYGADCPAATGELVNLCRCKYFNGCIATEVIPDSVLIFSHPVEALQQQTFASLLDMGGMRHLPLRDGTLDATSTRQAVYAEWKRMRRHVARPQDGAKGAVGAENVEFVIRPPLEAPGTIRYSGLLLLEVPQVESGATTVCHPLKMRLLITLSNRHLDYLEGQFVVVGEVREGCDVVEKMRAAPHRRLTTSSGITTRPSRLVRIKHTTVLPTAGTSAFADIFRGNGNNSAGSNSELSLCLMSMGCFRYWAMPDAIVIANKSIISLLKEASCRLSTADGELSVPPSGSKFIIVPGEHTQKSLQNAGNWDGPIPAMSNNSSNESNCDIVSVEYNPHFHGDYLSSDDEDTEEARGIVELRNKCMQRQQAMARLHQDKLNETRSLTLNLLDGIADATGELKPEGNVLFVCKLNPITTGEGLEMCFSQFGKVKSAQVIKNPKTGDSLCYGFVEFSDEEDCYRAYQKMDNALVDDRRIHVDFSQSVSKLWMERQRDLRKRPRHEK
ncbi:unnamed protein product [Trypanosoma congolense IL3000]|uniref:Peptidyl-prolyl cis-trans isomerase n=1 Tax=Trypanosoma congolense (strain IL3000) TaxID=1068625 RepID=F9WBV8_TRYCI|nr:unnamed protein product [Trypanosoma congolense IL3000]